MSAVCSFPGCNRKKAGRGVCNSHYWQLRSGRELSPLHHRRKNGESPVVKFTVDENGCHIWSLGRSPDGYGRLSVNGVMERAHRYVWELVNGKIPNGLVVCHKCDVPLCCRIDHLFLGTHNDNVQDKVAKGRQLKGQDHSKAKLLESDVLVIRSRRSRGETLKAIANDFGVCEATISMASNSVTWSHLLGGKNDR